MRRYRGKKIVVCYVLFNQMYSKGAINVVLDNLYDALEADTEYLPVIVAERYKNAKVIENRRTIYSYKVRGGKLRTLSTIVNLLIRLLTLKDKPDVVHLHQMSSEYFIPLYIFSRLSSVPIVVTNHNFDFERFTDIQKYPIFKNLTMHDIYKNTYFICLSREIYKNMCQIGIPEHHLIHNPYGIVLPRIFKNHSIGGSNGRVIWIGRYSQIKNIPLLLETWERIWRNDSSKRLSICGVSMDEVSENERNAIRYMNPSIELLGFVDDIYKQLTKCDCCVVTSISEACSVAVLEALACGVPVVSTPVSAAKEVIEENCCGIVTKDWNPAELAKAVESILDNQLIAHNYSINARRTIESKYHIGTMIDAHKKLYRKIVNK